MGTDQLFQVLTVPDVSTRELHMFSPSLIGLLPFVQISILQLGECLNKVGMATHFAQEIGTDREA